MSRLIVISNRVASLANLGEASAGGLAMALGAALREGGGVWFGWTGETCETFTGELNIQQAGEATVATVDLEEADVQEYYNGYANKTLWPLMHDRVDLAAFDRSFDEGYARVNRRLAETVRPLIQPDDIVWVHDYHLLLMARELRRLGVDNPIGLFLHTPWPARQLFTTLPRHAQLAKAIFDLDLVGFRTPDWLSAFEDYVVDELGGTRGPDGRLGAFGRALTARAFPIGIDAQDFVEMTRSPQAMRVYDRMAASSVFRQMIVGVDRLDYSKGLEERLLGYERLLHDRPEWLGKVFLLQIAPPTREEVEAYQEIRSRLDAHSGRINGAFAELDWNPIRYVNRSYRRDELAGVYRAASIGYVTPLRDGMNLVAKEYVAAQRPDDPGVLVLSRFAGAAAQMKDALIVNPHSPEELADALHRALSMEQGERVRRWEALMDGVMKNDVTAWRDDFVTALRGSVGAPANDGAFKAAS